MFLINGQRAVLRQFNRTNNESVFDDQNYQEINIKVCPYDVEETIRFGTYTVPEATGYYQVPRYIDIREGDQIIFKGNYFNRSTTQREVHTVLKVQDEWLFNRVENYIVAVK